MHGLLRSLWQLLSLAHYHQKQIGLCHMFEVFFLGNMCTPVVHFIPSVPLPRSIHDQPCFGVGAGSVSPEIKRCDVRDLEKGLGCEQA